jgi:hypothetical protein
LRVAICLVNLLLATTVMVMVSPSPAFCSALPEGIWIANAISDADLVLSNGDFITAVRMYNAVMKKDLTPTMKKHIYANRGLAYMQSKEFNKAKEDLAQGCRMSDRQACSRLQQVLPYTSEDEEAATCVSDTETLSKLYTILSASRHDKDVGTGYFDPWVPQKDVFGFLSNKNVPFHEILNISVTTSDGYAKILIDFTTPGEGGYDTKTVFMRCRQKSNKSVFEHYNPHHSEHVLDKSKVTNNVQKAIDGLNAMKVPHKAPNPRIMEEHGGFMVSEATMIDIRTGLEWVRDANLRKTPLAFFDAEMYVANLNYAGYKNWRLPTQGELADLAAYGGAKPSEFLSRVGFRNIEIYNYWTSSTEPTGATWLAWRIDLTNGDKDYVMPSATGGEGNILPVRDRMPGRRQSGNL